jgi:hypothetical protein
MKDKNTKVRGLGPLGKVVAGYYVASIDGRIDLVIEPVGEQSKRFDLTLIGTGYSAPVRGVCLRPDGVVLRMPDPDDTAGHLDFFFEGAGATRYNNSTHVHLLGGFSLYLGDIRLRVETPGAVDLANEKANSNDEG